jgi:hypothetical protein
MSSKKQFMISVDEVDRDRLDALRIVMGVSRAEAARQALQRKGLAGLESAYHPRLARLYALAQRAGCRRWPEYVRQLTGDGKGLQRLPSLEELEDMESHLTA